MMEKDMEVKNKNMKEQVVKLGICIGLMVVIWGGFFVCMKRINQQIKSVIPDDYSWVVQVDEMREEGGKVLLDGFAFDISQNADDITFEIVLQNIDTGEFLFPRMEYVDRKDVNQYFLCKKDYTRSGFSAQISEKKMDLGKYDYEVLIRYKNGENAYQTGTYISKGEMVFTNPKEFVAPNVKGTDLEKIVEDGVLRVYEPEHHVYVYQYQGELYWLLGEKYEYKNGDTTIQFQMDTTQPEKLPKQRLEKEMYWDDLEFLFSSEEIEMETPGEYRVAKRALPTSYSLTRIWTGNYDEKWVWQSFFRPWYELK